MRYFLSKLSQPRRRVVQFSIFKNEISLFRMTFTLNVLENTGCVLLEFFHFRRKMCECGPAARIFIKA